MKDNKGNTIDMDSLLAEWRAYLGPKPKQKTTPAVEPITSWYLQKSIQLWYMKDSKGNEINVIDFLDSIRKSKTIEAPAANTASTFDVNAFVAQIKPKSKEAKVMISREVVQPNMVFNSGCT